MLPIYGIAAFIVLFLFFIFGKEAETEVFEGEYRLKEYIDGWDGKLIPLATISSWLSLINRRVREHGKSYELGFNFNAISSTPWYLLFY